MTSVFYTIYRSKDETDPRLDKLIRELTKPMHPIHLFHRAKINYVEFQEQWVRDIPTLLLQIQETEKKEKLNKTLKSLKDRAFGFLSIDSIMYAFEDNDNTTVVFYTSESEDGMVVSEIQAMFSFQIMKINDTEDTVYIDTFGINKRTMQTPSFVSGSNIFDWFYRKTMLKTVGFKTILLSAITTAIPFWRKSKFLYVDNCPRNTETECLHFQRLNSKITKKRSPKLQKGKNKSKKELLLSTITELEKGMHGAPMFRNRSKTPSPEIVHTVELSP